MLKTGVVRKSNCIINTGNNPTRDERKMQIENNRKKYGLTIDEIKLVKVPKFIRANSTELLSLEEIETDKFSTVEIIKHLSDL
jgi:hypothetical protein